MKIKEIIKRIPCMIGLHEWTSAAMEEIKPTQKQIDDGIEGFKDYSRMYCKHCDAEVRVKTQEN